MVATKKTKKLPNPPKVWQQVHDAGRRKLVKAEAQSTVAMRTAVRQIHRDLLAQMGDTKLEALRALKGARAKMAQVMSDHIAQTRTRARDAALDQTQLELRTLAREAKAAGHAVPTLRHALGSAGEITPTATAADLAAADAIGHGFASRWAQSVMHHVVNSPKDEPTNIAIRARLAVQQMDHQVKRIAATENSRAFNDQHEEAIDSALKPSAAEDAAADETDVEGAEDVSDVDAYEDFGWRPRAYKYWDAYLDRATCTDCVEHNGEMVPLGKDFSGNDSPGYMHPNCRCIESIVYLED